MDPLLGFARELFCFLKSILVVEADARGGSVMVGTARFARHFLLPI